MDTWGLTILAKARTLQGRLTALMMTRELFELYRAAAVAESFPAGAQPPEGLTWVEQELYRHLLGLEKGRVEQEFIPRERVVAELERWRVKAQ